MNRRWLRVLLGALVLAIWGAVIVRALRRPTAPEGITTTAPATTDRAADIDTSSTFPSFARDPFLDGGSVATVRTALPRTGGAAAPARTAPAAPPPIAPVRAWPKVTYKGTIRAQGDPNSIVAFLAVEGRDVLIRSGGESQGITVVRLTTDSIVLRWNEETRTFARR